jgi:hypothetical protein
MLFLFLFTCRGSPNGHYLVKKRCDEFMTGRGTNHDSNMKRASEVRRVSDSFARVSRTVSIGD